MLTLRRLSSGHWLGLFFSVDRALDEECILSQLRAAHSQLENLNNSNLTLSDAGDDIRGRKVIDRHDAEIGHVSSLFIDPEERKVRMLEVRAGGFLGLGERHFLVPMGAVVSVDKKEVRINQSREHVLNSPAYDPKLIQLPVSGYWEPFYGYYGLPPYGGFGYLGPTVPLSPEEKRILDVHSSIHDRDL